MYESNDLENFNGPFTVFSASKSFWGTMEFWSPEVYKYNGKFYMFASFRSATRNRGTQILCTDSQYGPFEPLSKYPITPEDWMCLDGTLYVDEKKRPWMIFCHEWLQIKDGSIEAMELKSDLSAPAGEPKTLFHASEAPWTVPSGSDNFITDGPFVFEEDGKLCMFWSSVGKDGYAMGIARSSDGITGKWTHDKEAVYTQDGGHGMLFKTFDGTRHISLHAPNKAPRERAVFIKF